VAKVVPESCQRTDGIDAWLEIKTDKETKRMEKESRQRDKKKVLNDITEERNSRNAERQRSFELKQLKKLVKEDSTINQDMIEEKEIIIKELEVIIDNKGALELPCENCEVCRKEKDPAQKEKECCKCICRTCEETRAFLEEHPPKPQTVRGPIRCVKKIRGKRGKPDTIEYLVNIDTVQYDISKEQLSDLKEVFSLFDKDGDGIISFTEITSALKTLGQRIPEDDLREMVKQVSEDKENDTLEFNEFLTMMGLQNIEDIKFSALVEAFSVFDKNNDGYLSIGELRKIMTTMGQRMKKREVEEMVLEADLGKNGLINLKDFCSLLIFGKVKNKVKKTVRNPRKIIQEKCKDTYSSRSGSFSQG